ncbi:multidrug transporter EmrE-like cation transporter [Leucobacter komagatae]|uniref:Multidrug transporter EmrE-like cation transporter n=1 Tax=Leucobacter komagatae TaxID=55969 RepID=A0A542Y384_9MICO|nr:SMR family transporter [Leucobacter komagatae]TQL42536.1 multidrug transporter EmrE-like cation transporter [Leucobacter komagatae]
MTLTALGLVLAAAFAHAAWNILAAKSSRSGIPFLFWGAIVSAVVWSVAIPFTGGIGSGGFWPFMLAVAVSGVLHVLYMLVLQRGYRAGDLSTVYATARGSGPVLTVIVSILLFGERPGLLSLSGVLLVVVGVTAFGLIGRRSAPSDQQFSGPVRRSRFDPSIVFGLLTGVAIATYTLWDVSMVNGFGIAPVAFMVGTSVAEAVIFGGMLGVEGARGLSPARRMRGELRTNWRSLLAFGVLSPLSYVLVLTAATIAPLSLVAPMRETSVVLVGLYGVFRYRESNPALRLTAAVVVVCGVALIGL